MRPIIAALLMLILLAMPLYAALSDSQALTKARTLWGSSAMIGQRRGLTDTYWTKQVGCVLDSKFIVAGAGLNTYEAAFLKVDLATNGPRVLTAVATDNSGNKTTSAPVTIYLCNAQVP